MASKEEWLDYFKLMNGRVPTSEEFAAAKASGDFDSEGEEKEVDLENSGDQEEKEHSENPKKVESTSTKKKKKKLLLTSVALLIVLLLALGAYFAFRSNSKAKELEGATIIYNGKLVQLSNMKAVNSKFETISSRSQVADYYFVTGYFKDSKTLTTALMDKEGNIVDDELVKYNASTLEGKLRLAEELSDKDTSSLQDIYYSKVTDKYYLTNTPQNAGMIELSKSSLEAILEREPNALLVILNSGYYESTVKDVKYIKEIESGKTIYNSNDHPNMFEGYKMSDKYLLSERVKKDKSYTYNVYKVHDLEKSISTVEIPISEKDDNPQGEWTADGETYVAGNKDKVGNYTNAHAIDANEGKVAEIELDSGNSLQVVGDNIATLTKDNELTVTNKEGETLVSETINPGEIANVAGEGTDAEVKDVNAAYEAVIAAEKLKADAESRVEKEKKEAEEKSDSLKMDLEAISKGDYSSIVGTWESKDGKNKLFISSDKIEQQQGEADSRRDYDLPKDGEEVGKEGTAMPAGTTAQIVEKFSGMKNGAFVWTWTFDGPARELSSFNPFIGFYPKNIEMDFSEWSNPLLGDTVDSNISQERILIYDFAGRFLSDNTVNSLKESATYYRTSDDAASSKIILSDDEQAKIDKSVESAQAAIDKLESYDWAQTDREILQARLDKVTGNDIIEKMKSSVWEGSPLKKDGDDTIYTISWDESGELNFSSRTPGLLTNKRDLEWYTDFSYEVTGPNEVTITYYQMDKELILNYPIFLFGGVGGYYEGAAPEGNVEFQAVFKLSEDGKVLTLLGQRQRYYMTNLNGADLGNNHRGLVLNQWTDWSGSIGDSASYDLYLNGES